MNQFVQILIVFISLFITYRIIGLFVYLNITRKLVQKNNADFVLQLGNNYEYRFLSEELMRFKWKKNLIIVKATFKPDGTLNSKQIRRYNFFDVYIKVIFI